MPQFSKTQFQIMSKYMHAKSISYVFIIIFGILCHGCGDNNQWDGHVKNINGIKIVVNNGMPKMSSVPFLLDEVVRFGGDSLYDGLPLNRVFSAVQDESGNIYVSDIGNYRLLKYTVDGNYIKSYGERGQGPNEFSAIGSIAMYNNSIFVQDTRRRTISRLSIEEGLIMHTDNIISVDVFGSWDISDNGEILVSNYLALSSDEYESMVSYSGDGDIINRFNSSYSRTEELRGVGAFPSIHVSNDRVYYAWPYPYRVEVLTRDLQPLLNIELVDSGLSEPSKPRVVDGMNIGGSLPAQISKILEVSDTWVLVEVRYSDIAEPRRVDVFDTDGQYLSSFKLESGEGISSYSAASGMLWSTINGGMRRETVPQIIGRKLSPLD